MIRERVRALLEEVAAGRATIDQALARLDSAPVEDLGFANIDHHRALRAGFPEVVFGEGKSVEQTTAICERIAAKGDGFLVTRASDAQLAGLRRKFSALIVNELARTARAPGAAAQARSAKAPALIVTAGTSDLPVAEEAAETLAALNLAAARLTDVGVAGIHRLLSQHDALRDAGVVIVVAGMDGALPSVVGGLVRVPVIAVPTSVGYGASFQGLSALLAMLNSCAAGVTVCNIDNGFGAAMAAARILNAQ
jgi:pyridinium-3,5-biscarboxylic acid mononucleotide synthase